MKQSLKSSIKCFGFFEQVQLYATLIFLKAGLRIKHSPASLFNELISYAGVIEQGVAIKKIDTAVLEFTYEFNNHPLKVLVRRKTSDLKVFQSVILHHEYKLVAEHFLKNGNPVTVILDAGANIGVTSLYFKNFFPHAKIIALEPDPANFNWLKKNIDLNNYDNIACVQSALWTKEASLKIVDTFRDGEHWSLSVEETLAREGDIVQGTSLPSLLNKFGVREVDIFKIDIEGTERYLFNNTQFVNTIADHVKSMVIEIHDEYNIRPVIYSAMQQNGFEKTEAETVSFFFQKTM